MRFLRRARSLGGAALFFAVLAAAGSLSGCGEKPVATVNGQTLSEPEFLHLCETASQISPQGGTVGAQVLVNWIKIAVCSQEARRLGIYPSEAELNARMQTFRQRALANGSSMEEQLRQGGVSMETFKRAQLEQLITEKVMFNGINVPDTELRKVYNANVSRMSQPETATISQITVDKEDKAKKAKTDLDGGARFELVAQSYSKDPFAEHGGQVPFAVALGPQQDQRVPVQAVREAFKLKEGQYSSPIQVGATWVIVRLNKKNPKKTPTFEEMRELIRNQLLQQEGQKSGKLAQNQLRLASLVGDARIDVNRVEYQSPIQVLQQAAKHPNGGMGGPGAPAGGGAAPGGSGEEMPPAPPR